MTDKSALQKHLASSLQIDLAGEESSLQKSIEAIRADKSGSLEKVWVTIRSFERLLALLYRFREVVPLSDSSRIFHEDAISEVSHLLLYSAPTKKNSEQTGFTDEYRQIWREEISLFFFCLVLFCGSTLVGWFFTYHRPEYVAVLLPQNLAEMILDKEQWFAKIKENPLLNGTMIAINNIKVCLYAFALGVLFGVGGLGIMAFNGIFLGAIIGYAAANGFSDPLGDFIVGHGPLELSIIVASAFASVLYGRAFYLRPWSSFSKNLKYGARRAFIVLMGVVPWLILAACIEGFVSPFDYLPSSIKMVLGCLIGGCFWVWTFWPPKANVSKAL